MLEHPFTYCLDPQRIKNHYTGETLVVPCGHCTACSMRKSRRYSFQCDCEAKVSKYVVFVTLTYANTYVPRLRAYEAKEQSGGLTKVYDLFDVTTPRNRYDVSLNYLGSAHYHPDLYRELQKKCHLFGDIAYLRKRDVQLFLKTFRDYLPEYEIRYFAAGEYGPETFRPHFHLLLYINDSELVQASEVCHMSDFPQWTWPKKSSRVVRPDDKISILEYYIRKTWKYGIVDCELITDGTASSYVASYVNGSQPLPSFLTLPATKCFCVHSRFLGGKIFRKEFVQVLSTPVDDFIKGSLEIGNKFRDYSLTYQNYFYYFPRCKGYVDKSSSERMQLYQSYDKACTIFKTTKLIELSRSVADVLYNSLNADFLKNTTLLHYYGEETLRLVDILFDIEHFRFDYKDKTLFNEDWDKIICRIYSQLLCSRLFCTNVKIHRLSPDFYLRKIEEFYSRLDYLHLKDFLDSQQKYFLSDYADADDIVYFYNNTDYEFDNYKNSFAYKAFKSNIKALSKDFIKHKVANDKNQMFVYG